jgi:hypothetical protein
MIFDEAWNHGFLRPPRVQTSAVVHGLNFCQITSTEEVACFVFSVVYGHLLWAGKATRSIIRERVLMFHKSQ